MMQNALDYPRLRYDCDSGAAHVGHLPRNSVFKWNVEEREENAYVARTWDGKA